MIVTYTGITAELKNYGIALTAVAPDCQEKEVFIDGRDIKEFYDCNPAAFMDRYGESEAMLFEMFELVNGIHIND